MFDSAISLTHFLERLKYGDELIEEMKQLTPLKDTTDIGDCADAFVMLAKNGEVVNDSQQLTRLGSCTGATLTVDAGLSLMSRSK